MFAEAKDFNVFDNHHFVVGDRIEGVVHDILDAHPIAAGEETERARDSARGSINAFPLHVFTQ